MSAAALASHDARLSPLRCKNTETSLDVGGVHTWQGDYVAAALQAAVDRADINEAIVDELGRKGQDRKAWLLFASGVEHGRHLCKLIRARGIEAACVFGETPSDERDATVRAFRAGRLLIETVFGGYGEKLVEIAERQLSIGRGMEAKIQVAEHDIPY